jgi:serine/threonine protein kinase
MITILGYQVVEQLYESPRSFIYRGVRECDRLPVILKTLKQEYPSPEAIARLRLEYTITHNLDLAGVVKAYSLEAYPRGLAIVLEDFGGVALSHLIQPRGFTLLEVLNLAIQITQILGDIHQQNIIHKDINPSNIAFNPTTGQIKIIDFGIAAVLSRENPTLSNPKVIEGTLAYMSPEQTGRMNRVMDYRTDFYSLGILLYQLLCDRLPFVTTDALEMVHCHIAKRPIPPQVINLVVFGVSLNTIATVIGDRAIGDLNGIFTSALTY